MKKLNNIRPVFTFVDGMNFPFLNYFFLRLRLFFNTFFVLIHENHKRVILLGIFNINIFKIINPFLLFRFRQKRASVFISEITGVLFLLFYLKTHKTV
jgi:hypothetical protein